MDKKILSRKYSAVCLKTAFKEIRIFAVRFETYLEFNSSTELQEGLLRGGLVGAGCFRGAG